MQRLCHDIQTGVNLSGAPMVWQLPALPRDADAWLSLDFSLNAGAGARTVELMGLVDGSYKLYPKQTVTITDDLLGRVVLHVGALLEDDVLTLKITGIATDISCDFEAYLMAPSEGAESVELTRKACLNKETDDGSTVQLYDDDGVTKLGHFTVTKAGSTITRSAFIED